MNLSTHKNDKHSPLTSKYLSILAGAMLLMASPVYAQHSQSSASGGNPHAGGSMQMTEQKQEIQQKIMEMRQLQKERQEIQKDVLDNNPDLQKQEEALKELMQETLDANLAAQDIEIERLKTLQAKLKEGGLPEEEKSKLEAEFSQKVQKYKKARNETLNDPEVTAKREALVEGIEEKSPEATKIGQKLDDLEQEIRQSFAKTQQ